MERQQRRFLLFILTSSIEYLEIYTILYIRYIQGHLEVELTFSHILYILPCENILKDSFNLAELKGSSGN